MLSKIYDYGIKGLGIGFIITNISLYFFMYNDGLNYNGREMISCYIVWAIASIFFGLASFVYDINNLGALYKTLIHFGVVVSVGFFTTSYMLRNIFGMEIDLFSEVFPMFIIVFLIIYLVLWTVFYFTEKACLAKLNAKFK